MSIITFLIFFLHSSIIPPSPLRIPGEEMSDPSIDSGECCRSVGCALSVGTLTYACPHSCVFTELARWRYEQRCLRML